ncbi:hypothetical protein AWZ03_007540 [Drosophila navojoa]|uniref:Uncharacterized protein n=1 Tax=Drosophila navojoa TaxID=7232 RepID=A0A484BBD9_DRONA|nr:hypothetical protein AWZ03_007540 [Drosophila navojoa]
MKQQLVRGGKGGGELDLKLEEATALIANRRKATTKLAPGQIKCAFLIEAEAEAEAERSCSCSTLIKQRLRLDDVVEVQVAGEVDVEVPVNGQWPEAGRQASRQQQ